MEESQILTAYEPLDLSTIKPCKITSERDFESESNTICELLKDISKNFYSKLLEIRSVGLQLHCLRLNIIDAFS
jgi:hypothetical protein